MQKVPKIECLPKHGGSTISFPSSSKALQLVETSTLKQTNIVDINAKQLVTNTEIMWSIDVVLSNYSFNSVSNKSDLFYKMFTDTKTEENFSCGKANCSYVVCFGLAPYFKGLLSKTLSNVEHVVALLDESFSKISKRGQIDTHVRYWDNNRNYAANCYYHSEFMGKASAKDVSESFSACLSGIIENKLLQVSSDGPDVNLSLLDLLETGMKKNWANLLILEHVVYILCTIL